MMDFGLLAMAAEVIMHTVIFSLTAFVLTGTVMLVCYGLYSLGGALWEEKRK
jgi:hypothetical protein